MGRRHLHRRRRSPQHSANQAAYRLLHLRLRRRLLLPSLNCAEAKAKCCRRDRRRRLGCRLRPRSPSKDHRCRRICATKTSSLPSVQFARSQIGKRVEWVARLSTKSLVYTSFSRFCPNISKSIHFGSNFNPQRKVLQTTSSTNFSNAILRARQQVARRPFSSAKHANQ